MWSAPARVQPLHRTRRRPLSQTDRPGRLADPLAHTSGSWDPCTGFEDGVWRQSAAQLPDAGRLAMPSKPGRGFLRGFDSHLPPRGEIGGEGGAPTGYRHDRTTTGLLNLSSLVRCYTARLVREHVAQLSTRVGTKARLRSKAASAGLPEPSLLGL